jgi:V/A-type H+-transporting ATPase subunit I
VLSYLRLFALGLATSSMAIAFNELAGQVASQFTGVGVLLGMLVFLFGHTLNLGLGIVSAVVHGLRLNVIEYLNWGMPKEGVPFRPFQKKEQHEWKH